MLHHSKSSRESRVLLVEDEQEQAHLLRRWMERDLGVSVSIAPDGAAAEAKLLSSRYDLMVTDVGLPDGDGLRVLAKSKEIDPSCPALVVTARTSREVLLEALRGKADDFVEKPMRRSDTMRRMAQLLTDSRKRKESRPARRTVLAVSAHPDDAEIGCGGTLLKHRNQGAKLILVVMSNGARGGNDEERKGEATEAARRLGASLVLVGLKDGEMSEGPETIAPLEKVIAEFRPDVVYTHSPHDTHQDHRAVASASRVAARAVPNLYCYQSPSTTVEFRPTKFIAVADELEEKFELLSAYGSQSAIRSYMSREAIVSAASYWGRFAGFRPSEPLEVIRDNG